ncbi:immune-associated nucleotide-binding protein 5-like [Chanos chanos]|uniref:Immune-associated nucleotide-binding protein 5-like n=1 Tax=Chanos chanos TaxID=29144 RepID=A0A6J2X0C5_CHACN|nr:immune-associated nucleotide-binding protein 5-like [Chanos chanos]
MNAVNIVLLGGRWAGKSSCGNTILNKEVFTVGEQIEACVMEKAEVAGMQVTVVDTPSWSWVSAEDSSDELKQELKRSVEMLEGGSHVLLLIHPLGSAFIKRHQIAFQEHLQLLGADVWDRSMVLFSRGDWNPKVNMEQYIDKASEELKWLMEKSSHRYHVLSNKNRNDLTQVTELLEKINQMIGRRRRRSKDFRPPAMAQEVEEASGAQEETK